MAANEIKQNSDALRNLEDIAEQCAGNEAQIDEFLLELGKNLGPAAHQLIQRLGEERKTFRLKRAGLNEAIVGADQGLRDVMAAVMQVARSDAPVLILGETGTGKEVVARAVHAHSRRANGPILRVNCGAIPHELIDSELFGHERGSFTGAVGIRKGWFERADGGTLFLDEIGELPLAGQVRLLRVLQDGSFQRVGGERSLTVDVRLVAATNRDLRQAIREGGFREDLWFRVAVFPIPLPPLRERLRDIPALAAHFSLRAAERLGLPPRMPDAADLAMLSAYAWPGNIREFSSVIERAAILGDGHRLEVARALGVAHEFQAPGAIQASMQPASSLEDVIRMHIEFALEQCHGRVEGPFGAARLLALNPHTLRSKMRKLGVAGKRFKDDYAVTNSARNDSHSANCTITADATCSADTWSPPSRNLS